MEENNFHIRGLQEQEVVASRLKYGSNRLLLKKSNGLLDALKDLAREPMVVLLLVTAVVYLISGKKGDAIFLAAAVVFVAGISLFQNSRSNKALDKLKDFTQPKCKVIRNSIVTSIKSEDLVVGDSLVVEEGTSITADGTIVRSNDFSVNESVLTGESLPVFKDPSSADHLVFQGTTVSSGLAVATVTAIGDQTRLGQIGRSLEAIVTEKTPLELQINNFVKKMVIAGSVVFVIVWTINYLHSANWLASLTKALTLAMSILPEEIPVAFTTFMALGAWRLMQLGVVVKQIKTVETLGSASVICTDKTGTLTENRMSLAKIYLAQSGQFYDAKGPFDEQARALIRLAMWASEPIPFDPMEVALHEAYRSTCAADERPDYHMAHEYPLSGKPPMMTHIFERRDGTRIIAAKGAPEALLKVSGLSADQKGPVETAIKKFSADGYRVLGVAEAYFNGNDFPATQQEFKFVFAGLVAFYDPPKKNINAVLEAFYKAGIVVKIVTGDNALTTQAIAREINFRGSDKSISGDELLALPEKEFGEAVAKTNIFSRMFPDAKLKIINVLKAAGEIVAMTGDGVNDGPALKSAHIGIAMGRRGTEIAKEAASLILLEDDLSKMVDAIAMGRRIYANLKKAIQYIISIHIPIILTVFIPLVLGWVYPNIFSPVHIIFLELIMGPTCSIVYENEPMEKNTMLWSPRPFSATFFNWKELITSVIQGLVITAGTLFTYNYAVSAGLNEQLTRTMVFSCLLSANIFLTLVNRSFYYSLLTTVGYKNKLMWLIISLTLTLSAALIYVKPLADFFEFKMLPPAQLGISAGIGFISVSWFEVVKWINRRRH
ncbi:cation-translocating P-type ATPase [Mucilaginibacter sp. UR6-11]|uniref:cation-translocating P-type ATPase n=1 Tax=Mucilaginibacter sp. UR6-11 TaxID=1435644 RepID=UPI001E3E45D3|nr:cation-translocating P-type ATPase [Mucilaginibacter sp. UR6-11]MCC8425483.1 cation-translocating P-type ATPase [Mucilaginibacter sp. UR6-11]